MDKQFQEDNRQNAQGDGGTAPGQSPSQPAEPNLITRWLETLARLGLSDVLLRVGTNAFSLVLVVVVILLLRSFYKPTANVSSSEALAAAQPTPTSAMQVVSIGQPSSSYGGIRREARIHTTIPDRPRVDVIKYTVQQGDSIIGIGDKFGLKGQTILFGNYYTLKDDVHSLQPGQELNILPVDGTYYEWQAGDGLNAVAQFFGVKAETIVDFPGNHLDPDQIGDYASPNIAPGTWLIIPGGTRAFQGWQAPVGVTRTNPAVARVMGAGACGKISDGAVGFGAFIWPSNRHYLSGYDYSPETGHRGIDISGSLGEAVYAADAGVIVYVGWNDYGYGNLIMIDHGNGWQTLYAHLSAMNVVCGQSVGQGTVIGAIGSTGRSSGPHLHFEMMNTTYGKVNPWQFLPAP